MTLAHRYLAAAGIAAILMPILVLGLGAPIWAGLIAAFAIFLGLSAHAAMEGRPGARAWLPAFSNRDRALRMVLDEARPALAKLEAAWTALPAGAARQQLRRVHDAATQISERVAEAPERLAAGQRALTYYLPRAAEFAETYLELLARRPDDEARVREVQDVLGKLELAFTHYLERVSEQDLRALDLELKLVSDALREDLGQDRKEG